MNTSASRTTGGLLLYSTLLVIVSLVAGTCVSTSAGERTGLFRDPLFRDGIINPLDKMTPGKVGVFAVNGIEYTVTSIYEPDKLLITPHRVERTKKTAPRFGEGFNEAVRNLEESMAGRFMLWGIDTSKLSVGQLFVIKGKWKITGSILPGGMIPVMTPAK